MAVLGCFGFLVACLLVVALAADETGLVRLEQPQGTSSCSETYVCTTTGAAIAILKFNGLKIFEQSHSQYAAGSGVNVNVGDVTVGNLSRSLEADVCHDELRNTSDYCYKTMINVRLTPNTTCRVLNCTTSTFIDGTDKVISFGEATISGNRPLPRPTGLQVRNLTSEQATFTWNVVEVNCSTLGYNYRVSTTNCGDCPSSTTITSNNVTCGGLIPGQTCNISVQGVTECAVSDSVSLSIQVPQNCSSSFQGVAQCATTEPVTSSMEVPFSTGGETSGPGSADVGVIVGGAVGGAAGGLALLIVIAIVLCFVIVHKCNGGAYYLRKKGNGDSENGEEMENLEKVEFKPQHPDVSLEDGQGSPTCTVTMDHQAPVGAVSIETHSTEITTTTEAAQETTADKGRMIMASAPNGMSNRPTDTPPVDTTRGASSSLLAPEPTLFTGLAGSDVEGDVLNPWYEKSGLPKDSVTDNDIKRSVPKSVKISEPSRESEPSQPVAINRRGSSQFQSVKLSSESTDVGEYVTELLQRQDEKFAEKFAEQDKRICDQDVKIDDQNEKITALNSRVGELEEKVKKLTEERELLKLKCEAIERESDKKISKLTKERDILKSRCAEVEQTKEECVSQLCQQIEEMECKYAKLKQESDQEIHALKRELDMKQDELIKTTEELKHSKETLEKTIKLAGRSLDSQNTATPSKPDYRRYKSVPVQSAQYDFYES